MPPRSVGRVASFLTQVAGEVFVAIRNVVVPLRRSMVYREAGCEHVSKKEHMQRSRFLSPSKKARPRCRAISSPDEMARRAGELRLRDCDLGMAPRSGSSGSGSSGSAISDLRSPIFDL